MGSVWRGVERWTTEQIIMVRQLLVLATLITVSYSQSPYSHQYQFNDGGRRRFARRVITRMEPSDRNILGRDDERSSRREFSPIFAELNDINSPYLMIDSQKFTVLPAVPNLTNQRSQKSLNSNNNQNFLFPSTSNLKPIPAVPHKKTTTKKPRRVQNPTISSKNPVTPPPPPPPPPPSSPPETVRRPTNLSSSREERKKFKKCHGRCVQKFCLPVGTLAKHQACQDSCRDICTL